MPLGDVLNRRLLIPVMLLCSAAALVACAVAPSIGVLLVAITVLGLTTVSGQILTPLAGDLAHDRNRGHVVRTVVSGILTGILLSRTISGLVADMAGWRAIYMPPRSPRCSSPACSTGRFPHWHQRPGWLTPG